jgi:bacterioferritin-associated ferredoxin
VYVCLCNALTEHDVRIATRDGAARPAEVFAACRCRAQCGTCVRSICNLLGLGAALSDTSETAAAMGIAA